MKTGERARPAYIGLAAALVAHLPCCVLPVAIAFAGFSSGLWWLHALEFLRPVFWALAAIGSGLALWIGYRRGSTCADDSCEPHSRHQRWLRALAWASCALTVLSIAATPLIERLHGH